MDEQKLAGKNAFFAGWILLIPATVPSTVAYLSARRVGSLVMALPLLGLLAVYLVVAGEIQWTSGKGGIRLKSNPNMLRFGVVVVLATALLTALFVFVHP